MVSWINSSHNGVQPSAASSYQCRKRLLKGNRLQWVSWVIDETDKRSSIWNLHGNDITNGLCSNLFRIAISVFLVDIFLFQHNYTFITIRKTCLPLLSYTVSNKISNNALPAFTDQISFENHWLLTDPRITLILKMAKVMDPFIDVFHQNYLTTSY